MKKNTPPKTATTQHYPTHQSGRTTAPDHAVSHQLNNCSRSAKRILLVDDDPTVRDSLKEVLIGEGYAVIPAANGEEALHLAARLPIDLALLDLNMPVMNGWETFQQLTFEHPLIPVVIVTAKPNQLFTAVGAGAGALLEKPMEIPTLLQTIKKLLNEPARNRLARLTGQETDFHYQCASRDPAH